MAWPNNIAPQTPSAQYDPVPVTGTIYVQLLNNTYITIAGAKSRCRIDLPLYDQSVTRDEVTASKLGRGGMSIVKAAYTTLTSSGVQVVNGDLVLGSDTASGIPSVSVIPDEVLTMNQQDDNFAHVPPHQNILGQTMVRWYDGVLVANLPTGNMVGEIDAALMADSGTSPPKGVF